jgi:hypothetical protein
MRRQKLVARERGVLGNTEEEELAPLKAATKQRLVKFENALCLLYLQ